jgi:hypothetical protein
MPPRYAYWTILIDNQPTAFRARDKAELLPTLHQLKRTNPNAHLMWFARGRIWETPEQAQWAVRHAPRPAERRGRDWRPGGEHKDPRRKDSASRKPAAKTRGSWKDRPRQEAAATRPSNAPHRPPRKKPRDRR